MTTSYNPSNPNIKNYIHQNWNIIDNSVDCQETFEHKPIIGSKRLPNLKDMLINALICYPPKQIKSNKTLPNHCTRLGKCTYCPIIKKIDKITCNITGKIYKTVDLPKKISCELNDIVYLITCNKCNKYYVCETEELLGQESMSTNYLSKNQSIPESPLYPNTSQIRVILLGTCSLPYWNGAHPSTKHQHRHTEEGVSSSGCGILVLSIQLALTNLSNRVYILVYLLTLETPCSLDLISS